MQLYGDVHSVMKEHDSISNLHAWCVHVELAGHKKQAVEVLEKTEKGVEGARREPNLSMDSHSKW